MSLIPVPNQVSQSPPLWGRGGGPDEAGGHDQSILGLIDPRVGSLGWGGFDVVLCGCVVWGGWLLPLVILPMCSVAGFRAF